MENSERRKYNINNDSQQHLYYITEGAVQAVAERPTIYRSPSVADVPDGTH